MNIDCAHAQALISAAADGELTAEEMEQLQEHLAQCPSCQAAYDQVLAIHAAFADWEAEELPGDLTGAVMTRIRAEKQKKPRRRPYFSLALAAACCALMVLGYQLLPQSGNNGIIANRSENEPDPAFMDSDSDPSPSLKTAVPDSSLVSPDDELQQSSSGETGSASSENANASLEEGEEDVLILENVLTYFHDSPTAPTAYAEGGEEDSGQPVSIPTLSSSAPQLLDWMNQHFPERGYTSPDAETGTAATAWLITTAQYEELVAQLDAQEAEYTMEWEDVRVPLSDSLQEDTVCVIYLQPLS